MYPYPPCNWTQRSTTLTSSSVFHHLSMAASSALSVPSDSAMTHRSGNGRATVSSVFISASVKRLCWNFPIGRPKASRVLQYSSVSSKAASAPASAPDRQPLPGEVLHEVGEALALLAEEVGGRHPHVVEEQLGGVLGVQAHLVEVAAALEPLHA